MSTILESKKEGKKESKNNIYKFLEPVIPVIKNEDFTISSIQELKNLFQERKEVEISVLKDYIYFSLFLLTF